MVEKLLFKIEPRGRLPPPPPPPPPPDNSVLCATEMRLGGRRRCGLGRGRQYVFSNLSLGDFICINPAVRSDGAPPPPPQHSQQCARKGWAVTPAQG